METLTKNPGLQHVSEDILKLLDNKSLLICRLVNSSWKNILDQPMFWLKKLDQQNFPLEIQKSWENLVKELYNDQVSKRLILIMIKASKVVVERVPEFSDTRIFGYPTWTSSGIFFGYPNPILPNVPKGKRIIQPLKFIAELGKANIYPDLMEFILENEDPNNKLDTCYPSTGLAILYSNFYHNNSVSTQYSLA